METNSKTPPIPPRTFSITILQPGQTGGSSLGPTKTTYNDDIITGWVGIGSQLDGLGHIGVDNVYYNCNKAPTLPQADGLKKLGIEKVPPLVTRGIVLDMTAVTGQNPVPAGTAFNKKEIDDALAKQSIQIRKGDVVLFHTGWQDMATRDAKAFIAGEPGLGKEGAEYLVSKEVVADRCRPVGRWRSLPFEKGVGVFEVHQILLPRNGILHPREHEYRPSRGRQGLGVHVRPRPFTHHRRGAGHHQSRRDPVRSCKRGRTAHGRSPHPRTGRLRHACGAGHGASPCYCTTPLLRGW